MVLGPAYSGLYRQEVLLHVPAYSGGCYRQEVLLHVPAYSGGCYRQEVLLHVPAYSGLYRQEVLLHVPAYSGGGYRQEVFLQRSIFVSFDVVLANGSRGSVLHSTTVCPVGCMSCVPCGLHEL